MEKLGMNVDLMDSTGAAVTRQRYSSHHNGKPYPKMLWPSNYNRYAASTMFTLFYAGRTYAPDLNINGENVQDWLQNRYIDALRHAQRRLKNCAAIKGWGSMNEPHQGLIGHRNLEKSEDIFIPTGPRPSPWQFIKAASGYSQKIPVYALLGKWISGYETFNPEKVSLFKEGFCCPWKQAGVWQDDGGTPSLLKKDYFAMYQGRPSVFTDDFLKPFQIKFINAMKEADEKSLFFIEGLPSCTKEGSHPSWSENDPSNVVNAFHWYDGFSLFTKTFRSWFTVDVSTEKIVLSRKKAIKSFAKCLAKGIGHTKQKMAGMPCLLGEFGLAFDINKRKGLKTGNFKLHEEALSMYYDAVDANLLHSTLWNYTASNTVEYGDRWNDEDLSIFSQGKERAAAGWKRPYPVATAGKPVFFSWDKKRRKLNFHFNADKNIKAPTIIYLPAETFGTELKIETSLKYDYNRDEQQLLIYNNNHCGEVIKVRIKTG
jgi:hypothetical protein